MITIGFMVGKSSYLPHAKVLVESRITSYNVCYTKLLRKMQAREQKSKDLKGQNLV